MNNLLMATNLLLNISTAVQAVAQKIQQAQMENRDLTDAEMDEINISYERSFSDLDAAIAAKEGQNES